MGHIEKDLIIYLFDFSLGEKSCNTMLTVTYGFGLDSVKRVKVCQHRKTAYDEKHQGGRGY
ncbi:hypothetical protein SDC9_205077 [bioreactor metagenome]|uniref:Uncharacterized protein n=1 Tax=bioreactor metagenome TaxID=1076179 RepID=A0A645JCV5_9ZZZZ